MRRSWPTPRVNCDRGSVSVGVGSMSAGWSWYAAYSPSEPAEEYEGGYSGGLIRTQNRPAVGSVECWDADLYKSVTPIPDFDATLTFGIDRIEPGAITSMN